MDPFPVQRHGFHFDLGYLFWFFQFMPSVSQEDTVLTPAGGWDISPMRSLLRYCLLVCLGFWALLFWGLSPTITPNSYCVNQPLTQTMTTDGHTPWKPDLLIQPGGSASPPTFHVFFFLEKSNLDHSLSRLTTMYCCEFCPSWPTLKYNSSKTYENGIPIWLPEGQKLSLINLYNLGTMSSQGFYGEKNPISVSKIIKVNFKMQKRVKQQNPKWISWKRMTRSQRKLYEIDLISWFWGDQSQGYTWHRSCVSQFLNNVYFIMYLFCIVVKYT